MLQAELNEMHVKVADAVSEKERCEVDMSDLKQELLAQVNKYAISPPTCCPYSSTVQTVNASRITYCM